MDIAGAQLRREAVALGIEHEERVVADGLEMPVVRGLLLRAVDRAFGTVDVEDHPPRARPCRRMLNQVRAQASQSVVIPLLGEDICLDQSNVEVSATLVSRRSREASIRNVGSSASRSASLVSSYPARRL